MLDYEYKLTEKLYYHRRQSWSTIILKYAYPMTENSWDLQVLG